MHAEARGTRVAERDGADVVFDAAEIPFQPETIIADYL